MKNKNLRSLIQKCNDSKMQSAAFEILNPEMDYSIRGGDLKGCETKSSGCGTKSTCGAKDVVVIICGVNTD